jgi:FeS assembly SUF system regulator
MLRLSKLTDYGTVVLACMARQPDRLFAATELAAASGLSAATASKVLKLLLRGQVLQSVRGAKGGYLLARPAGEISLAQVIDALEGPLGLTECAAGTGRCAQEGSCDVRRNWQRINSVVVGALGQMTLADIAQTPPPQPLRRGDGKAGKAGKDSAKETANGYAES